MNLKKNITSPFIFAIVFLILLHLPFGIFAYIYFDDVSLDKPKFLEEYVKLLAAFFTMLIALGMTNLIERKRNKAKIQALESLMKSQITPLLDDLNRFCSLDPKCFNQVSSEEIREVNNRRDLFNSSLRNISEVIPDIYQHISGNPPEIVQEITFVSAFTKFASHTRHHFKTYTSSSGEMVQSQARVVLDQMKKGQGSGISKS